MKIDLTKAQTPAQAVTTICYNEPTRNLNFRIECEDMEDFKKCTKIIDKYNDFDYKRVNRALDNLLGFKRFLGTTNPNNKMDLFKFEIAREESVVVYVKYYKYNIGGNRFSNIKGEVKNFLPNGFESLTKLFKEATSADNCSIYEDNSYTVCKLVWN